MTNDTPAIQFDEVSKRFHRRGSGSFRDAVGNLLRRRDPSPHARSLWALEDLTFAVGAGEALGIIGPNGAGKSTALKLLSGITRPTRGRITVRGRVASLIEVGAGFHPDLTGKENIYLNGAIMGMSRAEVTRKFDDIVEFAELSEYINMPVKHYSSGMYMRLGFSVAAHLEPDVLLVDEVLAVGDRRFQAKSVKRMHEIVESGATVVFISHDLSAVQSLCRRGIYLRGGRTVSNGAIEDVITTYITDVDTPADSVPSTAPLHDHDIDITRIACRDENGQVASEFVTGRPMMVELEYNARIPITRPLFSIGLSDGRGSNLLLASMLVDGRAPEMVFGVGRMRCHFPTLPLLPRTYRVWCSVRSELGTGDIVPWEARGTFTVGTVDPSFVDVAPGASVAHLRSDAPIYAPYAWEHAPEGPRGPSSDTTDRLGAAR